MALSRTSDAKRLIHKAVLTGAFYPVLCGTAFKNKGVQPLLDAVVAYRRRSTMPAIKGVKRGQRGPCARRTTKEPLALLAFKIMDDPFVGILPVAFIPGVLISGTGVVNSTREKKERIGRMLLMHANNRSEHQRKLIPATSSLWPALKKPAPVTRCATGSSGHP